MPNFYGTASCFDGGSPVPLGSERPRVQLFTTTGEYQKAFLDGFMSADAVIDWVRESLRAESHSS
jgi:hypothetical protein